MKKMMIVVVAALSVASAADAATFLLAGDSTLDDHGRKPRPPYASWGTTLQSGFIDFSSVTHPIAAGAEAFAKLFIEDVKARNLEVATLFK